MYKRIDTDEDAVFDGWSFVDEDKEEYVVTVPANSGEYSVVEIGLKHYDKVAMFTKDIPKLIKALQAAYNHKE